jgi:hypothetical protein
MKINRITFSTEKNVLKGEQLKEFNKLTSYYEELIFNFLPKNTEVGGYGFLNTKFDLKNNKPELKTYGQIIDVFQPISPSELSVFLNSPLKEKVYFLGKQLKSVLSSVENQMSVEIQNFHEAIVKSNANHFGFEKELKVSKNHPSRKIKVAITRIVQPNNEFITCRIRNKKGEILDEFDLSKKSSVYDASYDFRKSKWNKDILLIFNRFDEVNRQIDVTKFLKKST